MVGREEAEEAESEFGIYSGMEVSVVRSGKEL